MLAQIRCFRRDGDSYLLGHAGEVVVGLEGAADALLEGSISTVIGAEDGVLEATGVLDVDVQLAVLALVGDGNVGADGGNVGVEDDSDDGPVLGDLAADSSLGATGSAIAETADGDLEE